MLRELLAVGPGPVDLTAIDPRSTPGVKSRDEAEAQREDIESELGELQERLWAQSTGDGRDRLLLVLQGMDTSGKDGAIKKGLRGTNPKWLRIASFGAPTEEERAHHFLWRIRRRLPQPGTIGVFDRSHYEDVLIARVRELAPAEEIERRYDAINQFEQELVDSGTKVLKCMLHISPEEQRERLLARLDKPEKHWKFNPGDIDERARWHDYQNAYEIAIERTNTDHAPWHVVPADKKWFRNLAIGRLLLQTLREMDPQWPKADFDVEEQRRRLQEEDPLQ